MITGYYESISPTYHINGKGIDDGSAGSSVPLPLPSNNKSLCPQTRVSE